MNTEKFDVLQRQIERTYSNISAQDIAEWITNPCTKWLLQTLENEIVMMFVAWYNSNPEEGASQHLLQGKAQAIDDLYDKIQEVLKDNVDD